MFTIFKQKIFYRYLLSYFVAFIIPFLLLGTFVYVNFIADLQEELEQASFNNLQQVSESIGDRKREFTNIATRISTDTRLTSYQLNHPYYSYEAIKELGKYRSNSILFDEIALVYHENPDVIFTSRGYHTLENFIARYDMTNLTVEELSMLMKEETPKAKIVHTGEGRDYLAIIQPIMPNSLFPHGSVTYMIEKKHFVSTMSTALSDLVGHTYILDSEQQVLAEYMNDDDFATDMLDFDDILEKANNDETITIEGKDYTLNLVEGDDGWSYISILQEGQLFGLFKGTLTSYVLMLLVVFFVGVIITYVLSKYQYKPIDLLVKQVKTTQKQSNQEVNELRQVMHAFEQLNHDKATLSKTLYKHRPFAQQQFWMHLLKGEYPTKEAMSDMASSLQLELNKAYYFVVILHSDSEGIKTFKQQVEDHLNYKTCKVMLLIY
ncbi:cache domain-containing protein [Halolactibacillus sp. JCM 19043]|uniref:cache domain-containing protein n=1 Tax=Halolactibacillus sp. JCM 19043 TaxID=1460638 RepID=UPI000781465D|nr:cache domain-containing protein [Halolactibacillus sp. JCM 19043]